MISLSIRTKLFIAIFLACLLTIGGVAGVVQFKFKRSFLDYLNEQENRSLTQLETRLISTYETSGDWSALDKNRYLWDSLLRTAMRSSFFPANGDAGDGEMADEPRPPPPFREEHKIGGLPPPRSHFMQRMDRFASRIVLLDAGHKLVRGSSRLGTPDNLHELKSQGKIVGYLGIYRRQRLTEKVDVEFADRLQRMLWVIGLLALPVTGLLAFLFARHLGQPIQTLRNGARQLTDGNYALRMKVSGRDELADLTRDVNRLAERLQQNEASRKQWIADIAHELRTPLSILRGEIEALQDGVNQPDTSTFASLHQEVSHLERLVGDLYDLSMSDSGALSYHKEATDIIALLRETLALHSSQLHEQELQVDTICIALTPIHIQGDPQRLQQLFKNLLENSLRYTDKPGQLRVSSNVENGWIDIVFEDSAPGVPDEALPRLFDRLYRVEGSRNRATGGAGLGLSICRNIVAAHDGEISAAHSALGGVEIRVRLPLQP
ncbi:ATP-binding protein [Thiothrix nivea]|uniref:histidine kinase n=1 Tax=Thiothrix nivea (strain ATCC 35100 / DSM 5205 / JP2) TaxID=870187 RepID=A0A656HE44_THINJ|nr:ATP-binding protein [Thiothrix nivea]EIJ33736.1 integral membrane sensor signal transduction histidine kinase [Thiothrix nivea DSM 5205]